MKCCRLARTQKKATLSPPGTQGTDLTIYPIYLQFTFLTCIYLFQQNCFMTCERKLSYLQFGSRVALIKISSLFSLENNRWYQIIKEMVMQSSLSDRQHAARHYSKTISPLQNTPSRQRWAALNKEFRYLWKSYDQLHYIHVHVHLQNFGRLAWKKGCLAVTTDN